jgi:hypothetical protein
VPVFEGGVGASRRGRERRALPMPVGATTSTSAPLTAASTISRCLPRKSVLPKAVEAEAAVSERASANELQRRVGQRRLTLLQDAVGTPSDEAARSALSRKVAGLTQRTEGSRPGR